MDPVDVVRACFVAFRAQDRAAAEALLAPGFVFTSPQDDHIDRAAYFERCFPTADRFTDFELLHVVQGEDDEHVVTVYEYELENGERYRNGELQTVRDGDITEVEVFFGGRVG